MPGGHRGSVDVKRIIIDRTEQESARAFLSLPRWHIKYQKTAALLLINEEQVRADKKEEESYITALYDLFLM